MVILSLVRGRRRCQEQGRIHKLMLELRICFKIYFMMSAARSDKMLKARSKNQVAQLPQSCGSWAATGSLVDTYTYSHTHTATLNVASRETSSVRKMLISVLWWMNTEFMSFDPFDDAVNQFTTHFWSYSTVGVVSRIPTSKNTSTTLFELTRAGNIALYLQTTWSQTVFIKPLRWNASPYTSEAFNVL